MSWWARFEEAMYKEVPQDVRQVLNLIAISFCIIMVVGFAIMGICELTSPPS